MKVFQINCMYKQGSTGIIVSDIHNKMLLAGHQDIVYFGRGRSENSASSVKFCLEIEAHIHHLLVKYLGILRYGGNSIPTKRVINAIEKERPDIVHIHCINCYCINIYRLLTYLGMKGIITVITHHAEFLYTGNCPHAYDCTKWQEKNGCHDCSNLEEATGTKVVDTSHLSWLKMKKAFDTFQKGKCINVAVSPWVKKRIKKSFIAKRFNCVVINNGIDTDIFRYRVNELLKFNGHFKSTVLHVTSSFTQDCNDLKGGWMINELAQMMPNTRFVIVCTHNHVNPNTLPDNVQLWGAAKNVFELVSLYCAADVTLILSKRETFSMVTAESLCCGTPVVGFNAGGPESIAIKEYSSFVDYGNLHCLRDSIYEFSYLHLNKEEISTIAHEKYSKSKMQEMYLELYKSLL